MAQPYIAGDACNFAGIAGANLLTTTSQYAAVYLSADRTFSVCDTSTTFTQAVGINQTYFTSGASNVGANIRLIGISKAIAGAAITAGDRVKLVGVVGAFTPCTAFTATATSVVEARAMGFALQGATTVGAAFTMFVLPHFSL